MTTAEVTAEVTDDYRHPDRYGTRPIPARVAERAATRYTVDPDSGCHLTTYALNASGYGQIGWTDDQVGYMTLAHRAAYVHDSGEQIPIGQTVDHIHGICSSRRCVRYEHLRLLSNADNSARTNGRDWELGKCSQGHPATDRITLPTGRSKCAPCQEKWIADDNERRREAKNRWAREKRARLRAERSAAA